MESLSAVAPQDREAVGDLLAEHETALLDYIEGRTSPALWRRYPLDDIAQDVRVRAMSGILRIHSDDPERVAPWLRTIARHRVRELWRMISRRKTRHEADSNAGLGQAETADGGPLEAAEGHEQDEGAVAAVRGLSRLHRRILALYLEGRTRSEIAALVGISASDVGDILFRELRGLRARLRRFDPAAGSRAQLPTSLPRLR